MQSSEALHLQLRLSCNHAVTVIELHSISREELQTQAVATHPFLQIGACGIDGLNSSSLSICKHAQHIRLADEFEAYL